ncbi:UNVERIFIED_CONTAM: hypothetical protein Sradi_3977000 [Sesamum radiatum]|uniref:Zinc knuckle CX2CX4HX4C domain-containing protein n=1 Tax=Sesamum radiatum TaxID=300843 RepID=A0AAW2PL94_SESRA
MNRNIAEEIGNSIGKFISTDLSNESHRWRKALRVRIKVTVKEPLKDHFQLISPDNKVRILEIRYERLSDFCHICGTVGHKILSCPKKSSNHLDSNHPFRFGPWIKAENPSIPNPFMPEYKLAAAGEGSGQPNATQENPQTTQQTACLLSRQQNYQKTLDDIPKIATAKTFAQNPSHIPGNNSKMETRTFISPEKADPPKLNLDTAPQEIHLLSRLNTDTPPHQNHGNIEADLVAFGPLLPNCPLGLASPPHHNLNPCSLPKSPITPSPALEPTNFLIGSLPPLLNQSKPKPNHPLSPSTQLRKPMKRSPLAPVDANIPHKK